MSSDKQMYMFNSQEWVQIRAALTFWNEVAEKSKHHPKNHSKVQGLFHQHGALSLDEIDKLANTGKLGSLITATDIAKKTKRSVRMVNYYLNAREIEPVICHTCVRIFRYRDVTQIIKDLKRAAAKKEKNSSRSCPHRRRPRVFRSDNLNQHIIP